MVKNIEEGLNTIINRDRASADNIKVGDLRLWWEDYGAYPFGWFYCDGVEKLVIGDEASMHSNPANKFASYLVRQDIKENGADAYAGGTFNDGYSDFDWLEDENEHGDDELISYISYNLHNGVYDLFIEYKDGNNIERSVDSGELYDFLCYEACFDEEFGYELCKKIRNGEGEICKDGIFLNVDQEIPFDMDKYLDAEYKPSHDEYESALNCMEDSGRYWVYDKVICFWSSIPNDSLQSKLDELSAESGIDFSDYRIVYEDEDTEEVKCVPISEYIASGNTEYVSDAREVKGIHELPSAEKRKSRQLQNFLKNRGEIQGQKLGKMPMAKYNYLKHPFGEDKKRVMDNFTSLLERISKNYNSNRIVE